MPRSLLAAAVAALAAPAAADNGPGYTTLYPETVPGGVTSAQLHEVLGRGLVGSAAFTLSPRRVTYSAAALQFRSLDVRTVLFGESAARLGGTGLVNGRRVVFTAVGVHNALPGVDVFRIAWNHGAAHGGVVTSGVVFIR